MTGNSYTYLSELKNGKKPLTPDFVQSLNNKMKTDFKLIQPLQDFTDTENIAGDQIPVYNVKVFGTISPVFDDNEILLPLAIKRIPHFSRADGAVQVNGHSMKGYINHGDWILIKKITNKEVIIYGEPYLIITKSDNLRTVKFVKECTDDEDLLTLVPYNIEQFEPQDIEKNEILELYEIVGLFRSM